MHVNRWRGKERCEERIIDWIVERLVSGTTVDEIVHELTEAGISEEEAMEVVEAIKQALEE